MYNPPVLSTKNHGWIVDTAITITNFVKDVNSNNKSSQIRISNDYFTGMVIHPEVNVIGVSYFATYVVDSGGTKNIWYTPNPVAPRAMISVIAPNADPFKFAIFFANIWILMYLTIH